MLGAALGWPVGSLVGALLGAALGWPVGSLVGALLGVDVGADGAVVGAVVGQLSSSGAATLIPCDPVNMFVVEGGKDAASRHCANAVAPWNM